MAKKVQDNKAAEPVIPEGAPYTKKCTAKILSKVLEVNPKARKSTSLDQAWVILAERYGLEGDMSSTLRDGSRFILYKDGQPVHEFKWSGTMWDEKNGDFDWTSIYRDVLEYTISKRLLMDRKRKIKVKEKIDVTPDEEEVVKETAPAAAGGKTLASLKKELAHLSARRSYYNKTGRPVDSIQSEMDRIKEEIKKLK